MHHADEQLRFFQGERQRMYDEMRLIEHQQKALTRRLRELRAMSSSMSQRIGLEETLRVQLTGSPDQARHAAVAQHEDARWAQLEATLREHQRAEELRLENQHRTDRRALELKRYADVASSAGALLALAGPAAAGSEGGAAAPALCARCGRSLAACICTAFPHAHDLDFSNRCGFCAGQCGAPADGTCRVCDAPLCVGCTITAAAAVGPSGFAHDSASDDGRQRPQGEGGVKRKADDDALCERPAKMPRRDEAAVQNAAEDLFLYEHLLVLAGVAPDEAPEPADEAPEEAYAGLRGDHWTPVARSGAAAEPSPRDADHPDGGVFIKPEGGDRRASDDMRAMAEGRGRAPRPRLSHGPVYRRLRNLADNIARRLRSGEMVSEQQIDRLLAIAESFVPGPGSEMLLFVEKREGARWVGDAESQLSVLPGQAVACYAKNLLTDAIDLHLFHVAAGEAGAPSTPARLGTVAGFRLASFGETSSVNTRDTPYIPSQGSRRINGFMCLYREVLSGVWKFARVDYIVQANEMRPTV